MLALLLNIHLNVCQECACLSRYPPFIGKIIDTIGGSWKLMTGILVGHLLGSTLLLRPFGEFLLLF